MFDYCQNKDNSKLDCVKMFLKGPTIKYPCSNGEGGGQAKSVHLLFL